MASELILIVEDNPSNLQLAEFILKAAGFNVTSASNATEGIKKAKSEEPDLILMDVWMPVGLGFSVAERLQRLGLGGIPIIFITASKQKALRRAAKDLGAVAFFEKPYDAEQLLTAIATALTKKNLLPEAQPSRLELELTKPLSA